MSLRRLIRPTLLPLPALFLLLSPAVLGGGCNSPGASATAGDGIVCAADGKACTTAVDCCSYLCTNAVCGPSVNNCTEDNGACESDEECCSDVCANNGYCSIPGGPGTCADEGDPCKKDAQCCSNACSSTGNCTVGVNGCLDDFTACTVNADCCSSLCTSFICQPVAM
jgi:hypothetical protein